MASRAELRHRIDCSDGSGGSDGSDGSDADEGSRPSRAACRVPQVKRIKLGLGQHSATCLGVRENGQRCSRKRREPFCDKHQLQWLELPSAVQQAISDSAELPLNAFNYKLWDKYHEEAWAFLRDKYQADQAAAASSTMRAFNEAKAVAHVEAVAAAVEFEQTLNDTCLLHVAAHNAP
jgi:hypothetical protein